MATKAERPDYKNDQASLDTLLRQHEKYNGILQEIANRTTEVFELDTNDVREGGHHDLADRIDNNVVSYITVLSKVVDDQIPMPTADVKSDILDTLNNARAQGSDIDAVPAPMRRRYEARISKSAQRITRMRKLNSDCIGKLITLQGMVTSCTPIKPKLKWATYFCEQCGFEIYKEAVGNQFVPEEHCQGRCKENGNSGRLFFQLGGSRFIQSRELRLQELPEDLPQGCTPKSIKVIVEGQAAEMQCAGGVVKISGVYLPEQAHGYKALISNTVVSAYFLGFKVIQELRSYAEYHSNESVMRQVEELKEEENAYERLTQSIAPTIFGFDDVKRSLLLQLVGGATQLLDGKTKQRGDIHILLMGDPGVAKSLLLKWISTCTPRGVYTTGKGSSGVGLTAAVVKDPHTNEVALEAGALVLSDTGVCCIDEFDKMDEQDRTSIHEAMEQQSISIAKGGIVTTLNARASVLAAANPTGGSWKLGKPASENINMPTSLLSRFDLLWLLLDKADPSKDRALADFIIRQHTREVHNNEEEREDVITPDVLRAFIGEARQLKPILPPSLVEHVAALYNQQRQAKDGQGMEFTTWITPRTLLSILRLSQALARLRLSDTIVQEDIDEASRLMDQCKDSLVKAESRENNRTHNKQSYPLAIFEMIKRVKMETGKATIKESTVHHELVRKGYDWQKWKSTLDLYKNLSVWHVNADYTEVTFLDPEEI